ncbi:YaaC family protein [Virgibacillus byunsanensis]
MMHSFYTYLQSQQTAQNYLYQCYNNIGIADAEPKSYENYSPFMYYIDHGMKFYENGKKIDPLLQPVLFFYGMVHLLKACLLTTRPSYPESTSLLAHGVSSRKRKKKHYTFMHDEVKIQHNGLFPYFSQHLFSIERFPFEKIKMNHLLALIPEMNSLFNFNNEEMMVVVGETGTNTLQIPLHLLDSYHLTEKSFLHRIKNHLPNINKLKVEQSQINIELIEPITTSHGPFFIDLGKEKILFPIHRNHFTPISEVMVHYLLLYNLSMLCRYEAEWWGELLSTKSELDYPFIRQFLEITSDKIPLLLENELLKYKRN